MLRKLFILLVALFFFKEVITLSYEDSKQIRKRQDSDLAESSYLNDNISDVDYEEMVESHKRLRNIFMSVKSWREIYIVLGTIITVVGASLNLVCILIFSQSKLFRHSSFPYYVYVISVIDTLNIFMRYLVPQSIETYVRRVLEIDYGIVADQVNQELYDQKTSEITSDYQCSIFYYIYNSLTLISVWLMAAVSLERWLVIKYTLQTRRIIKLRAIIILALIFVIIFSANVFDLAPGFYIKPQWYANLTLLCERDDKYHTINNSSHLYKSLGPIQFNTEIFAFTRTLFQSVLPFLVVLIFNSMIIYNFKKIKTAALAGNGGRAKSNSCVSVNSGLSDGKHNNNRSTFRNSHKRSRNSYRNANNINLNNSNNLSKEKQRQHNSNLIFANSSSRSPSCSPSPMHNYSAPNTPVTPTSLASALNLADSDAHSECGQLMHLKPKPTMSPTAPTTPTIGFNQSSSENDRKQLSNSFLMPPTFSSIQPRSCNDHHSLLNNDSATPSIGTTNSSANLSVATTTNLTATTMLNHHQQQVRCNEDGGGGSSSMMSSNGTDSARNEKCSSSLMITSLKSSPNHLHHKASSTVTTATGTTRVSFKTRLSKVRLNRETDIMLIVLSFSILLSQMPFTIVWYLIYYRLVLLQLTDDNFNANSPKVFYIIRILEMIYFSLNFFFYITLSPSLRKEIKSYLAKKVFGGLLENKKSFLSKSLMKNHLNNHNNKNENEHSNEGGGGKVQAITAMAAVRVSNKNKKNSDYENHKSPQPSKRLYSNSSGEYMDYLDKLRSISPIRRPAFLIKPLTPSSEQPQVNHTILNEEDTRKREESDKTKKLTSKKLKKFLSNKKNKSTNTKCSMKTNLKQLASTQTQTHAHTPKIVIDSLYDEDEELKLENDFILDKNRTNESKTVLENLDETNTMNNKRNRCFKLSSSSSLLSKTFDLKSNTIGNDDKNDNNDNNDIVDVDYEEEQERKENAQQIAYL